MGSIFPPHIRKKLVITSQNRTVEELLESLHLNTVCQSARCPNRNECFSRGTATFMIMGDICTRGCRFCAVSTGAPSPLDHEEPERVALAATELSLKHVVITSVTRDDLNDGGAEHYRKTVLAVKGKLPHSTVEVLIPDFRGLNEGVKTALSSEPDVLNHNIETIERLYPDVRPEADYQQSLKILSNAKKISPDIITKSGIMLGMGEKPGEVIGAMKDLRRSDCDILTLGQYLCPGKNHFPVKEYILPEQFEKYERIARDMGFLSVMSGPFVRSSFCAGEALHEARKVRKSIPSFTKNSESGERLF